MNTYIDIRRMNQVDACALTWQLLQERPPEANISHDGKTTAGGHAFFVEHHPYRIWYAIMNREGQMVGTVLLTQQNEVGVAILAEHRRKGYAREAVKWLIESHAPAPSAPGKRAGRFLANISPNNPASIALFKGLGFGIVQHTYAK